MLKKTALLLALVSSTANAISIPTPSLSSPTARVRTPDGFECSNPIGSSTVVQIGLLGTSNEDDYDYYNSYNHGSNRNNDEFGAYVSLVVPIGAPEPIDCSKLYFNALREQELKIKQLEAQLLLQSVDDSVFQ